VARIGEMIAYQSYNTKSPLNGEAARWVADNLDRLPLDPVSMLVDEQFDRGSGAVKEPEAARPVPGEPVPAAPSMAVSCPGCQTTLVVSPLLAGKRARCTKCRAVFTIPANS